MAPYKEFETVHTLLIHVWWGVLALWVTALTVLAIQEQSFDIYFEMGWIPILTAPLALIEPFFIRNTKINSKEKSVVLNTQLGVSHKIEEGTLDRIVWDRSFYILEFKINGVASQLHAPFGYYSQKNKKWILQKLIEYNPEAKLVGFQAELLK